MVWTYERTLEADTIPLASVERQILSILQSPLIGPYEEKLARSLSTRLPVDNRISEVRLWSEAERKDHST